MEAERNEANRLRDILADLVRDRDSLRDQLEQARELLKEARRAALEEAAKVCDDEARHWYGCDLPARMCASGIRALIEKGLE
jgi:tRNA(Ile)-lysidine synthase TilS/MesJ